MSEQSYNQKPKKPKDGSDAFDPKLGKVSERLLKLVHSKEHPEDMHRHHQAEHDEEIHIDERWLMTYADKMTILCGFFIMLFAMSTIDPVKMRKIQESTEKQFGVPNAQKIGNAIDIPVVPPIPDLRDKVEEQQKALEKLEREKEELVAQIEQQKQRESSVLENSKTQDEQTRTLNEQLKILEQEKQRIVDENTQFKAQQIIAQKEKIDADATIKALEVRVEELTKLIPPKIEPPKAKPIVPILDPAKLERLEKQIVELKRSITSLEVTVEKKEEKITELTEQLRLATATTGFAAFVMSWSTRDHDVDLVVEDPNGKIFDFKRRNHKGTPGLLVLDTRQGPGVEVWQADGFFPGVYKFKYLFYNTYGNAAQVPITGTLFTSKGRLELPAVSLAFDKNKTVTYKVQIDQHGKATLIR